MLLYIWLTPVACNCLGRALGLSLASGRLWEERRAAPAEQAAASEALMARLLPHLAPPTTALLWLLLRLLLDEQARRGRCIGGSLVMRCLGICMGAGVPLQRACACTQAHPACACLRTSRRSLARQAGAHLQSTHPPLLGLRLARVEAGSLRRARHACTCLRSDSVVTCLCFSS